MTNRRKGAETPKRKLRFGGNGLPVGSHTYWRDRDGAEHRAEYGDEVDADDVANLDEFLSREMAVLSDVAVDVEEE